MDLLGWPQGWFLILAAVVTLYQGWRGFHFQWAMRTAAAAAPGASPAGAWEFVFTRCIADAIFYLVSTAAGFAAVLLDYRLLRSIPAMREVSTGAAAMLVFLTLFGLLGIAGQLPYVLQLGKFPR